MAISMTVEASRSQQHAVTLQAEMIIKSGLLCATCGYDLRGLAPDGRCPECGTPIAHVLLIMLDRAGLAHWKSLLPRAALEGMRDGAAMLLISSVLFIATGFVPARWFDL